MSAENQRIPWCGKNTHMAGSGVERTHAPLHTQRASAHFPTHGIISHTGIVTMVSAFLVLMSMLCSLLFIFLISRQFYFVFKNI